MTKRIIQFGDCDPAGYVYTPRISYFVVEAAAEYLSSLLGEPAIRKIMDLGVPPAKALSIEFILPMKWDDEIDIQVAVKNISNNSFSFLVEAYNAKGQAVFTANLTQVCISEKTARPIEIPQELKLALKMGTKAEY